MVRVPLRKSAPRPIAAPVYVSYFNAKTWGRRIRNNAGATALSNSSRFPLNSGDMMLIREIRNLSIDSRYCTSELAWSRGGASTTKAS